VKAVAGRIQPSLEVRAKLPNDEPVNGLKLRTMEPTRVSLQTRVYILCIAAAVLILAYGCKKSDNHASSKSVASLSSVSSNISYPRYNALQLARGDKFAEFQKPLIENDLPDEETSWSKPAEFSNLYARAGPLSVGVGSGEKPVEQNLSDSDSAAGKQSVDGYKDFAVSENFSFSRDPFLAPCLNVCPTNPHLSELKLKGLIRISNGKFKGMLEDPQGRGYLVSEKMEIFGAKVTQINGAGVNLRIIKTGQDILKPLCSQ
jgi:hypothetical protein